MKNLIGFFGLIYQPSSRRMLSWFVLAVCLGVIGCRGASEPPTVTTPVELPHTMKGYELYSWVEGGTWYFTLTTATNRLKRYDEITSAESIVTDDGWVKITVQGTDELKTALEQLPPGESLFWANQRWLNHTRSETATLTLPPAEVLDDLRDHCDHLGVSLYGIS